MDLKAHDVPTGLSGQDAAASNGHLEGPSQDEIIAAIREGQLRSVIVGGADMNGVFRAKRVPAERFKSVHAIEFSDYMWVMDLDDYPQPKPEGHDRWWPSW